MKAYSKENNTTNMEVITTQLLPGLTLKALKALGMEIHCFGKRYESAQKYLAHHIFRKADEGKLTIFIHCYDFHLFQKQLQGLSRNPMITLRMFDEKCTHSRKLTLEKDFREVCVQELFACVDRKQQQKAAASQKHAIGKWYEYFRVVGLYGHSNSKYLNTITVLMKRWMEADSATEDDIVEELIALHNMVAGAYGLPTIKGRHDSKYNAMCSVDNNVYVVDSRVTNREYDGFNSTEDYNVYDNVDRVPVSLTEYETDELMGLCAGTRRTQHDIGTLFTNLVQIYAYYCEDIPMDSGYSVCPKCGYPVADTASHCTICDTFNDKFILCASSDPEYSERLKQQYAAEYCDDVFDYLNTGYNDCDDSGDDGFEFDLLD